MTLAKDAVLHMNDKEKRQCNGSKCTQKGY